MASRKIEDLCDEMRPLCNAFCMGMAAEGIDFLITCTRRTQAEQDVLFEQGRSRPGKIVTWTRNSKHITGKAFDIVIMENGKPDWSVSNPAWTRAGVIGEGVGLIWGGKWHSPDYPHFEIA
jgi:peptidoglycan L-alanyl-D-glutamate endopeptidase CwlK